MEGWNDMGLGAFEIGYLRDKEKREVDFVVARDHAPWFLVEVKYRDESLYENLKYYQDRIKAPHAFQVGVDTEYVEADCFVASRGTVIVPARTRKFSELKFGEALEASFQTIENTVSKIPDYAKTLNQLKINNMEFLVK